LTVLLLLQVGASQKLACVIDGESLMNDGSALVIFLVLQKIVEGQAVTVGGVSDTHMPAAVHTCQRAGPHL
jgi:NhaP-type Na+/H+ or K+/H+ antiporter